MTTTPFKPFDIVLVDIHQAAQGTIHCVKKRLAPNEDLNYVALSYRWGDNKPMVVPAVDYDAHVTAFNLDDFKDLCKAISTEPELCTIQYLWVDAICMVDAMDDPLEEKIHRMTDIYKHANQILAVPDLHLQYLKKDRLRKEMFDFISEHAETIYHIIKDNQVEQVENRWMEKQGQESKDLTEREAIIIDKRQNINHAFDIMQSLMEDWSNRVWTMSEYQIALKKNNRVIKYWLMVLNGVQQTSFFQLDMKQNYCTESRCRDSFALLGAQFRKAIYDMIHDRSFLSLLLRSRATRNADRFHALLEFSEDYKQYADTETIQSWRITDMISVRMRVRRWMTMQENLSLLYYSEKRQIIPDNIMLPSFDVIAMEKVASFEKDLFPHGSALVNFDVLEWSDDGASLVLGPKGYEARTISVAEGSVVADCLHRLAPGGSLMWVRIPLFINQSGLTLDLVGCQDQNVWIIVRGCAEKVCPLQEWVWVQDQNTRFRVY